MTSSSDDSMNAKPLQFTLVEAWPKLSWVASLAKAGDAVTVLHGPCVETHTSWFAEAVWDGEFSDGDFDRTEIVCGSGGRLRGNAICFVTSGDTLNRLYWLGHSGAILVSNSLPALLAVAGVSLVEGYAYADAMASITRGVASYVREIPSTGGSVHLVYLHNLTVDADGVREVPKPSLAPDFVDFATYRSYLFASAARVGRNASSPNRRHAVGLLATLSSGYDSCAAAVVAREAGAREAATIAKGRRTAGTLFDTGDSGAAVASSLGLNCGSYERSQKSFPLEDAAWAVMGNVGDISLSLFDYPAPLCLLFTGFMGDVLWDTRTVQPEHLHRKDTSGARFSEARLEQGVFLCSPVFWGCAQEARILALSHLPEMQAWRVGGDYDRPVPRRLLEEAGVKRGTFARGKRVASFNRRFGRPLSPDLRDDFSAFMARRGRRSGALMAEVAAYIADGIDYHLLGKPPLEQGSSCDRWVRIPSPTDFFLWANERLKRRYQEGLGVLASATGPAAGLAQLADKT